MARIEDIIATRLSRREKMLWHGQPDPAYLIWSGLPANSRLANALIGFIGILVLLPVTLTGVYFTWVTGSALLRIEGLGSLIAVLSMLVVGIVLGIGPWYWLIRNRLQNIRLAAYKYYVITNFRVMILHIEQGEITEEYVRQLRQISVPRIKMLRANGIGDVIFGAGGDASSNSDGSSTHIDIGFEAIHCAEEVLDQLLSARAETIGPKKAATEN